MKHIFYIHSYITYLVSLKVIEYEKLSKEKCIFLYTRGLQSDDYAASIMGYEFPFSDYPVDVFSAHAKFWKGWSKLSKLDLYIDNITKDSAFTFYTPQTLTRVFNLIISHSNCVNYCIIEEGLSAYNSYRQCNIYTPPKKTGLIQYALISLNYKLRTPRTSYMYKPGYYKIYGISEYSFPGYAKREIIGLPFRKINVNSSLNHILIFDALVENDMINISTLAYGLMLLFRWFTSNRITIIYYKLHPSQINSGQSIPLIHRVFKAFEKDLELKELPQDTILEEMAYNNNNAQFYIAHSSIGLYAAFCGCQVYSFANFLAEIEPRYKYKLSLLPEIFKGSIKFLN